MPRMAYIGIFLVRNRAPPLEKAVGSRNINPKVALKNTITRIESSGDNVRAMVIMLVKQAPAQVIQNPARIAPGRESNHAPKGWKICMVRYRSRGHRALGAQARLNGRSAHPERAYLLSRCPYSFLRNLIGIYRQRGNAAAGTRQRRTNFAPSS